MCMSVVHPGSSIFSLTGDCAIMSGVQRRCCVSFHHRGGEYSNTTMGGSLFDAAANALEFFCAPHWKGPRPRRGTVLDVIVPGDPARERGLGGRGEGWGGEAPDEGPR